MLMKHLIAIALVFCIPAALCAEEYEAIDLGKPRAAQRTGAPESQSQPETGNAPAAGCEDDPRLETEIVEIMETEDPVIVPPMTVTPETYISMEPEVIAKLAGQLVICPKNPVLKSGKTMRKVSIAFPVLWEEIQKAAISGDENRLKTILANFSSKPLAPGDILNLLSPVNFDKEKIEFLYKTAGLNADARDKTPLDFFNLTGGRPSEKATVLIFNDRLFQSLDDWKKEHKEATDLIVFPANKLTVEMDSAMKALQASGLTVHKNN